MIKVRIIFTLCAIVAVFVSVAGLAGHFLGTDKPAFIQQYTFLNGLGPSQRNKLLDAAPRNPERSDGTIVKLAGEIAAELMNSPADAELWATYASLLSSLRAPTPQIENALKMSYFVAPSDYALMGGRLWLALLSTPMSDPVLQILAQGDIRAILLKNQALGAELVGIHQAAPQSGKAFLFKTAETIAPEFASRLSAPR